MKVAVLRIIILNTFVSCKIEGSDKYYFLKNVQKEKM